METVYFFTDYVFPVLNFTYIFAFTFASYANLPWFLTE
jgi:hypothetical protein